MHPTHTVSPETPQELYSDELLREASSLKFTTDMVEREFQESFYGLRAHAFITKWGLLPGAGILIFFCIADYIGFTRHQDLIVVVRLISILPLLVLYRFRKHPFVARHVRTLYSTYLFLLANSVTAIIALTPDTDFAHRGYMLSYPMLIFTVFIAKPYIKQAFAVSIGFTLIFNVTNIIVGMRPLGFDDEISQIHFNLVMLSSIFISAITCYVLEVAERRDFAQQKIIRQDKERIELQQYELSDYLLQLRSANELLEDQNRRLDTLNAEKNQFLGIAAHDLKNPLTGINLSVAMVRRNLHRMTNDDVQKTMESVESSVTRMKDLIVNLLDINRIERGNVAITLESVQCSSVLDQIIRDFQERAAQKSIRIVREVVGENLTCRTDKNVILQILDNIVSNALKFSPGERSIFLRARSARDSNDRHVVRFEVQDQGPGLSADDMRKLFQSYQRLSAKPTAGEHSTGLGLSIVKKLVESMNGTIWCESEPGYGACFIVELLSDNPLQQTENHQMVPDVAQAAHQTGKLGHAMRH